MDNAGDDSDADDVDDLERDQRGLQRPLHARQRPAGLLFFVATPRTVRTLLNLASVFYCLRQQKTPFDVKLYLKQGPSKTPFNKDNTINDLMTHHLNH